MWSGADDRIRTGDLVITSDPLYRLSYVGPKKLKLPPCGGSLNKNDWWPDPDLNWGHTDFQSVALPTELSGHSITQYRTHLRGVGRYGGRSRTRTCGFMRVKHVL